jgi:hypothetical protein
MRKRPVETSIYEIFPGLREYSTVVEAAATLGVKRETARKIILHSGQAVRGPGEMLWIKRDFIDHYAQAKAHMKEDDDAFVLEYRLEHRPQRNYKHVYEWMKTGAPVVRKTHTKPATQSRKIDLAELLK